jgi:hypothetical protein
MTALPTHPILTRSRSATSGALLTRAGVAVTAIAVLVEGAVLGFGTTTSGTGHYQYAADYWLTAAAIPHAIGLLLVLLGVRRLQGARDGRLGAAGITVAGLCLAALTVIIVMSLVVAHEVQAGPTYILGTLGAVIGVALFAAGSWRVGLLPRWLLAIWPIVWAIGSYAAFSISPLLLMVLYGVMLVLLHRRAQD